MEKSPAGVADESRVKMPDCACRDPVPDAHPRIPNEIERLRRLDAEHRELRRALAIAEDLTRLALGGTSFGRLASALAQSVGNPVLIENRFFRTLGYAFPSGQPTRDERPLSTGAFLHEVGAAGIGPRLQTERQPLVLPVRPERGIAQARLVAPVVVSDDVLGYVSILERDRPLEPADSLIARQAAQTIGIEFARQQAALETELKLKGNLLDVLLQGTDASADSRGARASLLNYDCSAPQTLLLVQPEPPTDGRPTISLRELSPLIASWARRVATGSLVAEKAGQIVVLLAGDVTKPRTRSKRATGRQGGRPRSIHATTDAAPAALTEALRHEIASFAPELTASIAIAPAVRDARDLRCAYESARRTLAILRLLGESDQVISTNDPRLAVFFLFDSTKPEMRREFVDLVLGPLIAYDQHRHRPLVETLQTYLACAGNLETTARALNVHTSTLKYRLQRIAEVGGLDVRNADHRFNAALALRLRALDGDPA